ncbi:MAG: protein kinase [Planctomycetes bacterium]|nr:protein kinase [Planctomycetota bacterium]
MAASDDTRAGDTSPLDPTRPAKTRPYSGGGSDEPTLPVGARPGSGPTTDGGAGAASILGRNLVGDYRLLRELGQGGQGAVFLAEHVRLGRKVALKVLLPEYRPSPQALRRFQREAEVAARLAHPGICTVYELGEDQGMPFIAMEFVAGEALDRKIKAARAAGRSSSLDLGGQTATGRADEDSGKGELRGGLRGTLRFVEETARALHAAHEAGLVHRDIKPANVIAAQDGRAVILDFGLARDDSSVGEALTQSDAVMGTPAYMAPEQVRGEQRAIDRRSDVYALGLTLYECLTLERPFQAPTRDALYQQILGQEPPRPRHRNPTLPRDLEVVILTALEKNPDRRYQTALDLAEDLRRVRRLEPILARPAGPLLRLGRWVQRNPRVAVLALVLLVSASVFSIVLTIRNRELRDSNEALARKTVEATGQARLASERADALERSSQALEKAGYQRALTAAMQAFASHDLAGARARLAEAPESQRGWEWRHLDLLGRDRDALIEIQGPNVAQEQGELRLMATSGGFVLAYAGAGNVEDGMVSFDPWLDGVILEIHCGQDEHHVLGDQVFVKTATGLERRDLLGREPDRAVTIADFDAGASEFLVGGDRLALICHDRERGTRLLVVDRPAQILETRLLAQLPAGEATTNASLAADGSRLAVVQGGRQLLVLDTDGAPAPRSVAAPAGEEFGWCGFLPDGRLAAALSGPDGWRQVLVDLDDGRLHEIAEEVDAALDARRGPGWSCHAGSRLGTLVLERRGQDPFEFAFAGVPSLGVYSAAEDRLAVGFADGSIEIWAVASPRRLVVFREHVQEVRDLCWDEAGRALASIDAGGMLRLRGTTCRRESPSAGPVVAIDQALDEMAARDLTLGDWLPTASRAITRTATTALAERQFRARLFARALLPGLAATRDESDLLVAARLAPLIRAGAEDLPAELFATDEMEVDLTETMLQRFPSSVESESILIAAAQGPDGSGRFLLFREGQELVPLGGFRFDSRGGHHQLETGLGIDLLRLDRVVGSGTGTMLESSEWWLLGRDGMKPVLDHPISAYVSGWGMPFDRHIDARLEAIFDLDGLPTITLVLRAGYQANGLPFAGDGPELPSGFTVLEEQGRVTWQYDPVALEFREMRAFSDWRPGVAGRLYGETTEAWLERNAAELQSLARWSEGRRREWSQAAVAEYERILRKR